MFTVDTNRFYVIAVCSNPVRYHTRARLFEEFAKHMADVGAQLIVVECAYGDRPFHLTQAGNPFHLQFRTDQEIWHKENLINLGIQYLCQLDKNWKYVGWCDADIHFQRQDIIMETVHQLQHYDIVQMFSHVVDLGPKFEPIQHQNGFVWSYFQNDFGPPVGPGYTPKLKGENRDYYGGIVGGAKGSGFWHCGYAWAARRSALDKISLFDKAILGSADHHMAMGLIGQVHRSIPNWITNGYREHLMNWQEIAEQRLRRNIGYVPGLIAHHWHGNKKDRKYVDRWKILIDNQYDPNVDIARDPQGLYRLNVHCGARSIKLRDQIRAYFRSRNEDSIDVE